MENDIFAATEYKYINTVKQDIETRDIKSAEDKPFLFFSQIVAPRWHAGRRQEGGRYLIRNIKDKIQKITIYICVGNTDKSSVIFYKNQEGKDVAIESIKLKNLFEYLFNRKLFLVFFKEKQNQKNMINIWIKKAVEEFRGMHTNKICPTGTRFDALFSKEIERLLSLRIIEMSFKPTSLI